MAVGPDRVPRGLSDRAGESAVFDGAAVREKVLEPPRTERDRAPRHEARTRAGAPTALRTARAPPASRDRRPGVSAPRGRRRPGRPGARARTTAARTPPRSSRERRGSPLPAAARASASGEDEELAPGGGLREEILDEDVGPARPRGRLDASRAPIRDRQHGSPRANFHPRWSASAARRRRSTAAPRRESRRRRRRRGPRRVEIFEVACRSSDRRASVGGHSRAVVAHEDPPDAPAVDLDVDPGGSRVERVLDELLDRRRRPLDHLSGRDAVDDRGTEPVDADHG